MDNIEVIAFYLPQYYPTKEIDECFGKGFTEWTNVGKAKPLFKGHYQPKVPADLGYYDLRVPEIRKQQAELAREAGISAFCYYHYWFGNGKEMLEMPLREVVKTKEPDFPFCICWANHTWYRKTWDSEKNLLNKVPLLKQEYPGEEDVENHFYSLLDAFKDERYYKVEGKLLFVLYRIEDIPDVAGFLEKWQKLAKKEGLPGFCFMSYVDDPARLSHLTHESCEANIVLNKSSIESIGRSKKVRKVSRFVFSWLSKTMKVPLNVHYCSKIRPILSPSIFKQERIVPTLLPNWDNTPRRQSGAMILKDATPEQFYLHCKEVFAYVKDKRNKYVFLKSWNEWGEGNYMEPCLKFGHGYIKALRKALDEVNQ